MATICEATLGERFARAIRSIAPLGARADEGSATSRWDGGTDALSLDPRLAATALMLEVAHADGRFTPDERGAVACALREEFGVGGLEAERIVHRAERVRATAPGVWVFTNVLLEALTRAQREVLTRILGRMSEADGEATWPEHYAIRKISALLRVEAAHV